MNGQSLANKSRGSEQARVGSGAGIPAGVWAKGGGKGGLDTGYLQPSKTGEQR